MRSRVEAMRRERKAPQKERAGHTAIPSPKPYAQSHHVAFAAPIHHGMRTSLPQSRSIASLWWGTH
jgi:hypothetical protein